MVFENVSRRSFLTAAGGLAIGFFMPLPAGEAAPQISEGAATVPEINAWVAVKPDDTVIIRVARSEMGQGTLTGLAQLVAEELDCDWAKVTTEFVTPGQNLARNRVWGEFLTAGSRGIRISQDYVRKGGAAARQMLIEAAAKEWGVPAAEISAAKSVLSHKASGRSATFGAFAAKAARLEPPKDVKLKDPKDWKLIGQSVPRLDTAAKVNGSLIYGIDLKLPGLLNAAIRDCPVLGGRTRLVRSGEGCGHAGCAACAVRGRNGRCRCRRQVVAGEDSARRASHPLGRGPQQICVECRFRRGTEGGAYLRERRVRRQ